MLSKDELQAFSIEIAELFKNGKINCPVHLGGENESQLSEVFKDIKPEDWILGTWRSHYQWLLSGRDMDELRKQIIEGHSMHVYDKNFFTSAIVGGIAPIAVGLGQAIKLKNGFNKVWCFLGDMGASCGISVESIVYSLGHDLPITFVIEDNNLSVRTITREAWGSKYTILDYLKTLPNVYYYTYVRKYNHAGPYASGDSRKVLF